MSNVKLTALEEQVLAELKKGRIEGSELMSELVHQGWLEIEEDGRLVDALHRLEGLELIVNEDGLWRAAGEVVGVVRTQQEVIEELRRRGFRVLRRWEDGTVNMASDDVMYPVAPDGTIAGFATLEEAERA